MDNLEKESNSILETLSQKYCEDDSLDILLLSVFNLIQSRIEKKVKESDMKENSINLIGVIETLKLQKKIEDLTEKIFKEEN